MESVESFCKKAIEMGIDGAKIIDPGSVVTAEWVRMKCKYGCHRFGMSFCCPPLTPTPDMTRKVIDSYQKAILLHQRLVEGEKIEKGEGLSVSPSFALKSRCFSMDIIKPGAWDLALVIFARNVTFRVRINTDLRRDLPWRHVGLMFLRPQGIMGFQLKLCGHVMRK